MVDDPQLGCCKVYRKKKFAFDYMMVAETPLVPGESAIGVQEKLALIRRHQNDSTVQLQFSRLLEGTLDVRQRRRVRCPCCDSTSTTTTTLFSTT